jgi:hypothetical protein
MTGAGVAIAAQLDFAGTAVNHVAVATEDTPATYKGKNWETVAATTVESATGESILVRFSAESACYGNHGYCAARILVDGVEALPESAPSGFDFAFDHSERNTHTDKSTGARSMERVVANTAMGTPVEVKVQVRMVESSGEKMRLRLDDWTLSAWSIAP